MFTIHQCVSAMALPENLQRRLPPGTLGDLIIVEEGSTPPAGCLIGRDRSRLGMAYLTGHCGQDEEGYDEYDGWSLVIAVGAISPDGVGRLTRYWVASFIDGSPIGVAPTREAAEACVIRAFEASYRNPDIVWYDREARVRGDEPEYRIYEVRG